LNVREVKLHVETLNRFIGETMAMADRLDRSDSGAISVPWFRVTAEMALDVAASAG
jgi:hypothetical protein